jgi:hypothetical protein
MFVRKKLGGKNFINTEKSEVETNANIPQQVKQENIVTEEKFASLEANQEQKQVEVEKGEPTKKKQVRCKKWPQCKTDNCEFAHPSETVLHIYLLNYSVRTSLNAFLEINVFSFIQTFLASLVFTAQE